MEIQKYNQNSIAVFDGSEKSIIKAIQSELVNNVSDDTLDDKLTDLVKASHLIAGIKHSGDLNELMTTVNEIIAELRFNKTNLRIDEIEIAFKNGIHKKYGDYFGLNAVSFCQFIKAYVVDKNRLEIIKLNQVEEKKEPSLEQRFETAKRLALSAFDKFTNQQSIELEGATVYRFLAKLGIIKYSDKEQETFMTGARNEVIAKKGREKFLTIDKHLRAKIEREIKDVGLLDEKIKFTAQHNGLVQYFDVLTFESEQPKEELTELINQKAKQYLK